MKKTLLFLALLLAGSAHAADKTPLLIGDIGDYKSIAYLTVPYKHGVAMAVREINAAGGILGHPVRIISRDSKGDPAEAVRLAQELVTRDHVSMLINCDYSNNTLGVGSWTVPNHVPLIVHCSESDTIIWEKGNATTFRINPGGYMWTMASMKKAEEIYGDRLKNKRWVSIAPNFEFGQSLVKAAHKIAADHGLNPQWVGAQWPAYDKLDAGAAIQALERFNPDVVFCPMFANDLAKFVREAKKRGFIKNRIFISPALAIPEHLEMLKAELPEGWATIGMPYAEVTIPTFQKFLTDYKQETRDPFRNYALNGYNGIYMIKAAMEKAGSIDPQAMVKALPGTTIQSPIGPITMRAIDHQATTPVWAGISKYENGKPRLIQWTENKAEDILPDDAWIKTQRKGQ